MNSTKISSVCIAIGLAACTAKFDMSPSATSHVVDVEQVLIDNSNYEGKDWTIAFPDGWVINNKDQRLGGDGGLFDNVMIDVDAVLDLGNGKTLSFVASSLMFDDDPIDSETFVDAAVMLFDRNGIRVDDALVTRIDGVDASLAVGTYLEKNITIIQLALMVGETGHMFRCMARDVDMTTMLGLCVNVFEQIKLKKLL